MMYGRHLVGNCAINQNYFILYPFLFLRKIFYLLVDCIIIYISYIYMCEIVLMYYIIILYFSAISKTSEPRRSLNFIILHNRNCMIIKINFYKRAHTSLTYKRINGMIYSSSKFAKMIFIQ